MDNNPRGTAAAIADHLKKALEWEGQTVEIFNVAEAKIPFFDSTLQFIPYAVEVMANAFRNVEMHIWLSPLYHGGMTGVMKNCLDWLEISSKNPHPYLSGKLIGLVCWANGPHAIQGIQAMENVARTLHAWTLPFFVPLVRDEIYATDGTFHHKTQEKLSMLVEQLQFVRAIG
jgi:arsenic resistance protein ArsH